MAQIRVFFFVIRKNRKRIAFNGDAPSPLCRFSAQFMIEISENGLQPDTQPIQLFSFLLGQRFSLMLIHDAHHV